MENLLKSNILESTLCYYGAVSRALDHNEKYYSRKLLFLSQAQFLFGLTFPKKAGEKVSPEAGTVTLLPLASVSPHPSLGMAGQQTG